ncbi:MAG TPA: EAL domain-containing protein [Rhodocyclaceae bacterium]|nr:EAL domain-containing protein [Rhodocyclaceae bacterium]
MLTQQQILPALYDLAMAIASEVKLRPLQTRVLQRLMYHTGFPAGLLLSHAKPTSPEAVPPVQVEAAVGDFGLVNCRGKALSLSPGLLGPKAALMEAPALLADLPCHDQQYRHILRLPVDDGHTIVLLSVQPPKAGRLLEQAFTPILAAFSRAIVLCKSYEAAHADLVRAHRKTSVDLARFRAATDAAPSCFFLIDPETWQILDVNSTSERNFGYGREELLQMSFLELLPPSEHAAVERACNTLLAQLKPTLAIDTRHLRRDGSGFPADIRFSLLYQSGQPPVLIAISDNTTERHAARTQLLLADSAFQNAREGIVVTDLDAHALEANHAFTRITGYSRSEVIGQKMSLLKSNIHDVAFYRAMWGALQKDGHWQGEIWNRRKNGEIYIELLSISLVRDEAGKPANYVAVFSDISQLRDIQRKLERQANYDPLTDLPNRALLTDRLYQEMAHARHRGNKLAVCVLDLDYFRAINQAHGAAVGDDCLVEMGKRLREIARSEETVARLGGDEFALLVPVNDGMEELHTSLSAILEALAVPLEVAGQRIDTAASIGVTVFPDDDADPDTLLRHASEALYTAKQSGRRRFHFFDSEWDRQVQRFHQDTQRLTAALHQGELVLYYQPKVHLLTGRVIGAEALIRWNHPERGLLSPIEFLPLADQSDLIIDIGEWTVNEALRQSAAWRAEGLDIPVSVNIAGKHLLKSDFADRIEAALNTFDTVPPHFLELEILESSALANLEHARTVIGDCQSLGVSVALADFGTGYSSLAYLKQLPTNVIKIDQMFVRDILQDADDLAIVKGILGLAKAFNRQVIAEGVETEAHSRQLLAVGCVLAQGYGIARPMPPERLAEWVRTTRQPAVSDNLAKEGEQP